MTAKRITLRHRFAIGGASIVLCTAVLGASAIIVTGDAATVAQGCAQPDEVIVAGRWSVLQPPRLHLAFAMTGVGCLIGGLCWGCRRKQLDRGPLVTGNAHEAIDGLGESLIVIDQKGVVRFANRVFTELVGMPRGKVVGSLIWQLPWVRGGENRDPESASAHAMPWEISDREGVACVGERLQLTAGDQSVRTLQVSCSPFLGPDGIGRGMIICGSDATQLKADKPPLVVARDRADSASVAKNAFLANMSHEIRTPLNAVLGFADLLRRGMAQSREEEIEYLDLIHSSGHQLLELINNILDLSKLESGHLQLESQRYAPHQIIHEAVSALQARAQEHGLPLHASYDSDLPESIHSDPTKLCQIVTNLIDNAIKFTEVGSVTVRITARRAPKPMLQIAVQDTGIGMTSAQQRKAFHAFEQADGSTTRRFGGTGLGLSISRQFAEALGGRLSVTSSEHVGSTFTLELPFASNPDIRWLSRDAVRAAIDKQQAQHELISQVQLPGAAILVVDNGETNRRLIALILTRAGARVTIARDAAEALNQIAEQDFALVLMEMQMVDIDGYQATQMIRERGCSVPIIAVTSDIRKGDRQRCLDSGCHDLLAKPVQVDRLLSIVAPYIGQAATSSSRQTDADSLNRDETRWTNGSQSETRLLDELTALQQLSMSSTAAIHSSLPTDDEEMADIVREFVPRMKQRVVDMRGDAEAGHWTSLGSHAHWLRGSAGTTGFLPISSLAIKLQKAIHDNDQHECQQLVVSIADLVSRVVAPTTPVEQESSIATRYRQANGHSQ